MKYFVGFQEFLIADHRYVKKCLADGFWIEEDGTEHITTREVVTLEDAYYNHNSFHPSWTKAIRYAGETVTHKLDPSSVLQMTKEWQEEHRGEPPATWFHKWAQEWGPMGPFLSRYRTNLAFLEQDSRKRFKAYIGENFDEWMTRYPLLQETWDEETTEDWCVEPLKAWEAYAKGLQWAVTVVKYLQEEDDFRNALGYGGSVMIPLAFDAGSRRLFCDLPKAMLEKRKVTSNEVKEVILDEFQRLARHQMRFHCSVYPNPFSGQLEVIPLSLFGYFYIQLLKMSQGPVQFFECPGCWETKVAIGQAIGRKLYCSDRCRKRVKRREKAASGQEG